MKKMEKNHLSRKILGNQIMEQSFATLFEVVRHEQSLLLLPSTKKSNTLTQSKFTDFETDIKTFGFRKNA